MQQNPISIRKCSLASLFQLNEQTKIQSHTTRSSYISIAFSDFPLFPSKHLAASAQLDNTASTHPLNAMSMFCRRYPAMAPAQPPRVRRGENLHDRWISIKWKIWLNSLGKHYFEHVSECESVFVTRIVCQHKCPVSVNIIPSSRPLERRKSVTCAGKCQTRSDCSCFIGGKKHKRCQELGCAIEIRPAAPIANLGFEAILLTWFRLPKVVWLRLPARFRSCSSGNQRMVLCGFRRGKRCCDATLLLAAYTRVSCGAEKCFSSCTTVRLHSRVLFSHPFVVQIAG